MTLGAHMHPYSYMYYAPHRDGGVTNRFCFENDYFLIHGLGKCERVGEDSRHGDGM